MFRALDRAWLVLGRDLTLGSLPDRLARIHRSTRLVEEADGGLCITHEQAAKRVRRWAGRIAQRTEPGDVVVIAVPNGYEQLLLCYAASRAGAVPAPVNDRMRPDEVDHVIADSGASLVVRAVTEVDGAEPLAEPYPARPADVAALFYTSGTTGRPKGVALTHRALVGRMSAAALWPRRLHRDEAVVSLPVAHIMGFSVLVGLATAGIPVYLLPRFNPVRVLDAIESRRATIFVGVPAMYRMLEEAGAEDRDLTSVRVWGAGADHMPAELAQRFKARGATATLPLVGPVGQATFAEGYGLVETGGGVAAKVSPPLVGPGWGPLGRALGFPLPGYSVRVVDDDGHEVSAGQAGELQVKGPGVLEAYWGDEAATAAVMTDDGWLRTGDLARKGPLGMLVFEGRAKHVVMHGGYSVYPAEVEQVLESHPHVLEAVVVGRPDERLGEVPVAAVRLVPGTRLDRADLAGWASDLLSDYKVPVDFVAVEELPRTGTDKVKRAAVLGLFEQPGRE
jgi:acyl-CoA synthetase (AMP-forming)/AMP-acid ligase II